MNKVLFLFALSTLLFAQQFTPQPYIAIEGNNQNIFVSQSSFYDNLQYICWENHFNDTYRIMMRRISPDSGKIMTVYSSPNPLHLPQIQVPGSNIFVTWQEEVHNSGRIYFKSFVDDKSDTTLVVSDTTINCRFPALGQTHIAWASDSLLSIRSRINSSFKIDLPCKGCSDLSFGSFDGRHRFDMLYRQQNDSGSRIIQLSFNNYSQDSISTQVISSGLLNDRPRNSVEFSYVYRHNTNGIWSIIYGYNNDHPFEFHLDGLSLNNPYFYNLPLVTTAQSVSLNPIRSPDMLVFDVAAHEQKDIYFAEHVFSNKYPPDTINVSQSPEKDEKAVMTIIPSFDYQDSLDVLIFWEHTASDDKTDIWWTRERFDVPQALNTDKPLMPDKPYLAPNYPNPFNPSTVICFHLSQKQEITLTIYDVQGRRVKQLFKGVQTAGEHFLIFDATGLGSGLYFAVLVTGSNFIQSRKLVFLK